MKCARCTTKESHTRGHCEHCYRYLLHTGRFTQFAKVDVAETFVHIHQLRDLDWTYKQIGDASGVSFGQVSAIHRGEYAQVRGDTAHKILSVPLVESVSHHGIYSIGTRRRIQALLWMGWPAREIAERSGCKMSTINQISFRGGSKGRVSSRLAKRIADVYDEIAHLRGPSKQCASKAKSYGYVSPMAWDDIDDPEAEPVGVVTKRRFAKLPPPDELQWLLDSGESVETIAARFNAAESSVLTALRRVRRAA